MGDLSDRELERLFDLDDPAGPARSIDAARSAAIISAALRGAGFPSGGGGGGNGGPGGMAGKSAVSAKVVLVSCCAALAVATTAWWFVRTPDELRPPPTALAVASVALPASAAVEVPAAAVEPGPAEADTADADADPDPEIEIEAAPAAPPRAKPSHRHARVHASVPQTTAEAEDLLAKANAARMARDWRAADALYRRVARARGSGNGLAAQTARVASAELHLEHLGDAAGAARGFRAALAGGARAVLAEDARWGLAEAARALGDVAAERRALDDFLAHHPDSVRAERARARRAELGAGL